MKKTLANANYGEIWTIAGQCSLHLKGILTARRNILQLYFYINNIFICYLPFTFLTLVGK